MHKITRLNRRQFLSHAGIGLAGLALPIAMPALAQGAGPIVQGPIPYAEGALAPILSAQTVGLHYAQHHRTYVVRLNQLIAGTSYADMKLEQIVTRARRDRAAVDIFNMAGQVLNHNIYWLSMAPSGGGRPRGALAAAIDTDLGGYDKFRGDFAEAATGLFGSGWAWLVKEKGKLKIARTADGDTPQAHGQAPLLCIDVWEHAYYLDYQNRRGEYVNALIDKLLNWDHAAQLYAHA